MSLHPSVLSSHLVTRATQTISSTAFPPSPNSTQQMNVTNLTGTLQLVLKTSPLEVPSNGGTTTAQNILAFHAWHLTI